MLAVHPFRFAFRLLPAQQLLPRDVFWSEREWLLGSIEDDRLLEGGDPLRSFVRILLQRNQRPLSVPAIGGGQNFCAPIGHSLLSPIGGEGAQHPPADPTRPRATEPTHPRP